MCTTCARPCLRHVSYTSLSAAAHHPAKPAPRAQPAPSCPCLRYYLRNLSDTTRFPDWPLVDHIPLLQALLAEWRRELSRKPLAMSEGEALQVLGIAPGPDGVVSEDELRRAYRCAAWLGHASMAALLAGDVLRSKPSAVCSAARVGCHCHTAWAVP